MSETITIYLQWYECRSVSGYRGEYIKKKYTFPKNSRIIDLKYFIGQLKNHDLLEFEITSEHTRNTSSWAIYTDDMKFLEANKTYNYCCKNTSSDNLSHQIADPNVHWDACLLRANAAAYLVEKYQYTREPILVDLIITFASKYAYGYSKDPKNSTSQFWFQNFVLDPLMTFGHFTTLVKSILSDKEIIPFTWNEVDLKRDRPSRHSWDKDTYSKISSTFKTDHNDHLLLNRLENGYILQANVTTDLDSNEFNSINRQKLVSAIQALSLVKKDYQVFTFVPIQPTDKKNSSSLPICVFYANKSNTIDWFRYEIYSIEKRRVKIFERDAKTEIKKYSHPFESKASNFCYEILDKVPMEAYSRKEVTKLAHYQYKDKLEAIQNLLPKYTRTEMKRRESMYLDIIPRDFTIQLVDSKENELYSTQLSSGILLLHTGPCEVFDMNHKWNEQREQLFAVNMLDLYFSKKGEFADTKNGVMTINIQDHLFQSYSLDQHIESLEFIFRYCYLGCVENTLDHLIKHHQCIMTWTVYFHLGNLYDIMERLVHGEFIQEYQKQCDDNNSLQ